MESDVMKRFERLEDFPLDEDYDETLPLLAAHELSTCGKCGAGYEANAFMALALPPDGEGIATLERVTLAVRQCGCGNILGRRTQ